MVFSMHACANKKVGEMTQLPPIVSIIMPCFNSEHHLDQAIMSVVQQSFKNWELLICDDNSSDSSLIIAQRWVKRDPRIQLLRNKFGKGASGARNSCIHEASGRFIAFLDSDDFWKFDKLEKQISHMDETGSSFSISYYNVIDDSGRFMHCVKTPRKVTFSLMMFSNFIPCLTAVYDSSVLGKVFQPDIEKRNDYALWLTLFSEKGVQSATVIPEPLAFYRQNSYGLSSSKVDALKFFFICLQRYGGRNSIASFYFTSFYLLLSIFKKLFPSIYNLFVVRIR